jgi:hypothetical protein
VAQTLVLGIKVHWPNGFWRLAGTGSRPWHS